MAILGSFFNTDHVAKADQLYQKGELRRAAELYLKAERAEQAADVYAELGESDRAVEILRDAKKPRLAADLLVSLGEAKRAISLYDEAGAHQKAAELCIHEQLFLRAGRFFDRAGMYRQAAEAYAQVGEMEHSLKAWDAEIERLLESRGEAGSEQGMKLEVREIEMRTVDILTNLGHFEEAGKRLMSYGSPDRAAPLFERGRRYADAARAYLKIDRIQDAAAALEKAPDADLELRAKVFAGSGRHGAAAEILVELDRHAEAAAAFENAERWHEAANHWETAGKAENAAEAFQKAGRLSDAARCFAEAERFADAALAYRQAGDTKRAADAYREMGQKLDAARLYLDSGYQEAAIELLQTFTRQEPEYSEASRLLLAPLLDKGLAAGARELFEEIGESLSEVERWYWQGRVDEASSRYEEAEAAYERAMSKQQRFRDVEPRLMSVRDALARAAKETDSMAIPVVALPEELELSASLELGQPLEPWWRETERRAAVDTRASHPVVLVGFDESLLGENAALFYRRMAKVSRFEHPGVLHLQETARAQGRALLLYSESGAQLLADRLASLPLSPTAALNVLVQLCDTLTTALKLSLTHEWLSPRTILIDGDNQVRMVGMGLRAVLAEHDHQSRAYLAPEIRDGSDASPASDVYSLGLLAVELLSASLPWDWEQREALDPEHVTWPEEVVEQVPKATRHQLVRCLHSRPLERPSVEEVKLGLALVGLLPGQILAERYEILGELGRGGMSRVYRAKDRQFNEVVAIKTVLKPAGGPSEDEERLFQEVQICRKISHPNVVRVHDFGRFPGGLFVIMEFLDGPELDEILRKEAPLPLERVRTYMAEIAAALSEAHRLKVVHRDLKPANVMLVRGRVKVMDFGIATMSDDSTDKKLTRSGEVVGSPLYMAPEQIQGLPLDGTCDLYALGVIGYTLLTGQEPFRGESATAVIFKHLHEPPPSLRLLRPNLPDGWVEVIEKLLAKKPGDRYASAEALGTALHELSV